MTTKNENEVKEYLFPKWSNRVPAIILTGALIAISFIVFVFWYWFTDKNFNVGYQPEQPIPYSHKLHAGELGIDCRYCHVNVEKSSHATIPPTEICMNCHSQIKTDSPEIMKLRDSYASDKPVEWVRIHALPDYVYFDHSAHVNAGVSCVSCHGRVDKMEVVHQVSSLSMSWCLECHRDPAENIRPKKEVTNLEWSTDDPEALGKELMKKYNINPREDCSTCHR